MHGGSFALRRTDAVVVVKWVGFVVWFHVSVEGEVSSDQEINH